MELLVNKSFFGKENCLKIQLNNEKECYFHFGIGKNNEWIWHKIKMNDIELGEIIQVLQGKKPSVAFFHKINGSDRQIWVNKKDKYFFIKIKELSKSLSEGEQEVLRILLENIIWEMGKN